MRSSRLERGLAVVGATALLVVGFDTLTFAATGSSLILGQANTANAPTQVSNTGVGPALDLRVASPTTPALQVNSSAVVPNLHAANAERLGGLPATSFQRRCTAGSVLARADEVFGRIGLGWLVSGSAVFVCSGGNVEARRAGVGSTQVRFGYSMVPRRSGLTGIPIAQLGAGSCVGGSINSRMRRDTNAVPAMNYVEVITRDRTGVLADCPFSIALV